MTTHIDNAIVIEQSTRYLYTVDCQSADDPESDSHHVWTAEQIGQHYPHLAPLFTGDGTESLTYVHELFRIRIAPIEYDTRDLVAEHLAIYGHTAICASRSGWSCDCANGRPES